MLPIQIPAGALKSALSGLTRTISRRTTLPVLSYVLIEQRDGAVRLTATDLDLTLCYAHPTEPPPITPLARKLAAIRWAREAAALLVPLETLKAAVKATARDDNAVVAINPDSINYPLAGQTVTLPFAALPVAEFPTIAPRPAAFPVHLDLDDTRGFLEAGTFSSTDETRYILNGLYLETQHGDKPCEPSIVATDGRRLHRRPMPALAALGENVVVPTAAVRVLGSPAISAHDWRLAYVKGRTYHRPPSAGEIEAFQRDHAAWEQCSAENADDEMPEPKLPAKIEKSLLDQLVVTAGPWTFHTKVLEGNYPNYRQVIPGDLSHHITAGISTAAHLIFRTILAQLPPCDKPGIALAFHGDHLEVRDAGGFTAVVPGVKSDAPVVITLDRAFLVDALTIGPGFFRLLGSEDPLLYFSGLALHVLMPLRNSTATVPDAAREALEAEWLDRDVSKDERKGKVVAVVREGLRVMCRVKWADSKAEHSTTPELPSSLTGPGVTTAAPAKRQRRKAA